MFIDKASDSILDRILKNLFVKILCTINQKYL